MSRLSLVELIDRQNEVVRLQSSIINELFRVTLQHVPLDDLEDIIDQIKRAADIADGLNMP